MLHVIRQIVMAFAVLWSIAGPVTAFAEVKMIEADGYYIMGDGPAESLAVAKERARMDARRAASEEAGIFVEGLTEVRKGKLTRDEVRTISSNILEVQESSVKPEVLADETIRYHCHMVVKVDTSNITAQLQQDRQQLDKAVKRNKELEAELAKANAELANLKQQYAKAQDDAAREAIQKQVTANEEWFTKVSAAFDKIESGLKRIDAAYAFLDLTEKADGLYQKGDYDGAIATFEKAMEVYPKWQYTPLHIGQCYETKGEYGKALEYYQKALALWEKEDKSKATVYRHMASSYNELGQYDKAVEAAKEAIRLHPRPTNAYILLGKAYYGLNRYEDAVRSLDKAEKLSKEPKVEIYRVRGICYALWKKYDKALPDLEKALSMDPSLEKERKVRDAIREALGK